MIIKVVVLCSVSAEEGLPDSVDEVQGNDLQSPGDLVPRPGPQSMENEPLD